MDLGTAFAVLYAAHLLADYPGQTDHQATHKADRTRQGWTVLLIHAGTHVAITAVVLTTVVLLLNLPVTATGIAAALAWVGVSHGFIDRRWAVHWWMENTGQADFLQHGGAAHVDQAGHIGLGLLPAAIMLAAIN